MMLGATLPFAAGSYLEKLSKTTEQAQLSFDKFTK